MHHKLVTSHFINEGFKIDGLKLKKPKRGIFSGYASDSSCESNMTSVAVDHVPLKPILAHVVSMELGMDPVLPGEDKNCIKASYREMNQPVVQNEPPRLTTDPIELAMSAMLARQHQLQRQKSNLVLQLKHAMQHQFLSHHTLQAQWGIKGTGIETSVDPAARAILSQIRPSDESGVAVIGSAATLAPPLPQQWLTNLVQATEEHSVRPSLAVTAQTPPAKKIVANFRKRSLCRDGSGGRVTPEKETESQKRPRNEGNEEDSEDEAARFRPYQYEQWYEKFLELCAFKKKNGHCQVPHTFEESPPLARWVKRQRYQYKLKMEGKQSTMTDDRIKLLENIGFIWDSHGAAWYEKLEELKKYTAVFGDCNVPSTHSESPQLATWVKCQRRQYKLLKEGKTSGMTSERVRELEKISFSWEMRKGYESHRRKKFVSFENEKV